VAYERLATKSSRFEGLKAHQLCIRAASWMFTL